MTPKGKFRGFLKSTETASRIIRKERDEDLKRENEKFRKYF